MNGRFLKPGIGIFQRINDKYDQFPTLPVLNAGTRSFKATKTGARWTQDLKDPQSGFGYHYVKSVQLVPGKPQMTISHVLTNTGKKPIVTTVYNHNFLTLSPGNEHVAITAPFAMTAEKPLQPELAKLDGKAIRYLAPLPAGVTVTSLIGGFGTAASDYDFTVTNTADRLWPAHPRRPAHCADQFLVDQHHAGLGALYRHRSQARPDQALDLHLRLLRTGRQEQGGQTMRAIAFTATLLATTTLAFAQGNAPFIPPNEADTSPASALDSLPSKTITNGIVSAKVYLPVPFGFYRSTRFDHAGMITHITYKDHDYGQYWFVKTSPDVQNFTYDKDGLVAHPLRCGGGTGGGIRPERIRGSRPRRPLPQDRRGHPDAR